MRRAAFCILLCLPILGCGGKTADDAKTTEPAGKSPQGKQQRGPKQPAAGPVDVARKFMEASDKQDAAAVKKLVTEKSKPFIEKNGVGKGAPQGYTLGKAVVTGEMARVPVKPDKEELPFSMEIMLKREAGQWRVYGVSMQPLMTLNFENPKKMEFKAKVTGGALDDPFGDEDDTRPAPPPLKSLSIEEFNKSWKSDYHYKDRPAREVLTELAKNAGMKFDAGFRPPKQLDKPVSLDLKNVSLARAIEEVCGKAGMRPQVRRGFRGPSTLWVTEGARPQPPVYAGPFAVGIDSFDVAAQYATGRLRLAVAAYNLPPAVQQTLNEMHGPQLKIDKLTAANGRDVRLKEAGTSLMFNGKQTVPLKDLLRDVTALTMTGKISLPIPVDVQQLRFTELKAGESKSAGDATVSLKESEPQTQTKLQLQYATPDSGRIKFTPLDAAGKPLDTAGSGRFSIGGRVSKEVTVAGTPAALKAELGSKSVTFKTLKPGEKQPLAGTEITLKKVRSSGRHKLTFEIKNADVHRIFLTGLDADGKPLPAQEDFSFGGGNQGQIGRTVLGAPKTVVVSVVKKLENVDYDVTLKDIPVPNADQRPVKLASLQFTGDAPVTLEVLDISRKNNSGKVKLQITNHSNKDLRRIEMRLHYLDASGKELKNWSAQADSRFNPRGGGRKPVVGKKATAEVEVTAFFMPRETKRVTAELQEVLCSDATNWRAKKKEKKN